MNQTLPKVTLKKGREKSLLRRHPWIFSGAIDKIEGKPEAGETVDIHAADGKFLARGAYSPHSQIRVRVWTFEQNQEINAEFFRRKISAAINFRHNLFDERKTNSFRLIFSESDGLPGLIVDKYNELLVCQFLSAGAERWKNEIVSALQRELSPSSIYERSDAESRKQEGLPLISGMLAGGEPPELVEILENQVKFLVDIRNGHKTGFYLDQRDNRLRVADFAGEKEVLNCFSYSGGFGVFAALSGARHIVQIDSSETALQLARCNAEINGVDDQRMEFIRGDVFRMLRQFRDENRQFDLIILDPPKFAESGKQVQRAARAYKDINLLAFSLLRPKGILFTFSCSGHIERQLFQKIVADAALDAGKEAIIIDFLNQAPDHPIALNFPESAYLKGLICSVSI